MANKGRQPLSYLVPGSGELQWTPEGISRQARKRRGIPTIIEAWPATAAELRCWCSAAICAAPPCSRLHHARASARAFGRHLAADPGRWWPPCFRGPGTRSKKPPRSLAMHLAHRPYESGARKGGFWQAAVLEAHQRLRPPSSGSADAPVETHGRSRGGLRRQRLCGTAPVRTCS